MSEEATQPAGYSIVIPAYNEEHGIGPNNEVYLTIICILKQFVDVGFAVTDGDDLLCKVLWQLMQHLQPLEALFLSDRT